MLTRAPTIVLRSLYPRLSLSLPTTQRRCLCMRLASNKYMSKHNQHNNTFYWIEQTLSQNSLAQFFFNPIKSILLLFLLEHVFVTCTSHTYATASCGRDRVSGREISKLLLVPASACLGPTIILQKGRSIYSDKIAFWQLGPELRVSIGSLT